MSNRYKIGFVHVVPIIASMLFGVLCSYVILTSSMEAIQITPFSEDMLGSLYNALYFVVLVGIGATLLYLLLKRKHLKLITLVTGFALTVAVFMLSLIYGGTVFLSLGVPYPDVLVMIFATIMTIVADYSIFRSGGKLSRLTIVGMGGGLGAFLGFAIPPQSAILILGFLAVYDAFAVYRGPVGKIARQGLEHFRGLSLTFRDVQIGLGDLTFYSMLSAHMLIHYGFSSCLASMIGMVAGCLISFKMLERKGIFPGLPVPVLLGLMAGLLGSLLR